MIDHGLIFGGNKWEIVDAPEYGLCRDKRIYALIPSMDVLENEVARIMALIKTDELHDAAAKLPRSWFADGDEKALAELFVKINKRREHLPFLVAHQWHTVQSRWASSANQKNSSRLPIVPVFVH